METPATSASSDATMIAPRRSVMIDKMSRAFLDDVANGVADPSSAQTAHPSVPRRVRPVARRRNASPRRDSAVSGSGPITCCNCRITYLPGAVAPPTVALEDWVCERCSGQVEIGPSGY